MKSQKQTTKRHRQTLKNTLVVCLLAAGLTTGCSMQHARRGAARASTCNLTQANAARVMPKQLQLSFTKTHIHLDVKRALDAIQSRGNKTIIRVRSEVKVGAGKDAWSVLPAYMTNNARWEDAALRNRYSYPLSLLKPAGEHIRWTVRLQSLNWPKAGRCTQELDITVNIDFNPRTRRVYTSDTKANMLAYRAQTNDPEQLVQSRAQAQATPVRIALTLPRIRRIARR